MYKIFFPERAMEFLKTYLKNKKINHKSKLRELIPKYWGFYAQIWKFLIISSYMDFFLSHVSEEKAKHEAKKKI